MVVGRHGRNGVERPVHLLPVAVVDDQERLVREMRLDEAQRLELRLVVVAGVVVEDADLAAGEGAAAQHLQRVPLEQRRLDVETLQVGLERGAARRGERAPRHRHRPEPEVVDRHEVEARVAACRRDQARAHVRPRLDVALVGAEP